jgi:hypothetical protein
VVPVAENLRWYAFAVAQSPVESDSTIIQAVPRHHQRRVIALCIAVYVIVAIAVFWPAPPWDTSRLPNVPFAPGGFGDPAQMTWFLAWVPYALGHGLSLFQTGFLDYPLGVNLADNTSAPLLGLLVSPVTVLLGPIAAFNILLRLAFASSATSMFLVLRNWCRWPAAFVGGLAYGFGPYMVTQGQSHLNLVFAPLPPLIVWCLYELLFEQRRRPLRMGVLLGVLAGAQVLISPELLGLLVVVVALGLLGLAVVDRGDLSHRFGHLLRAAGPALAVFLIIDGWYFWCLLIAPGHLVGTVMPTHALQLYQADLYGPFIPTLNEALTLYRLWGISWRFVFGDLSENSTYLGIPAVILLAYFAVRWRKDRIVVFSAILAFVALVLSLGSPLTINRHVTRVRLPEALLAHVPIFDNIVPARFSFVVWLFAVIALTIGGDRLVRTIADRSSLGWSASLGRASGAVTLLLAVAFIVPRLPFETAAATYPPDTKTTLDAIPSGTVVLTYPFATSLDTEAMSWQADDEMRFRIIGGYATLQAGRTGLPVGPDFPKFGMEYEPLLGQPFIQEYLVAHQYNRLENLFYAVAPANVNPRPALCRFLATYHVGAVIFWNHGVNPAPVKALFLADLGTPTRRTHDKQLLVWLTPPGHCQS